MLTVKFVENGIIHNKKISAWYSTNCFYDSKLSISFTPFVRKTYKNIFLVFVIFEINDVKRNI